MTIKSIIIWIFLIIFINLPTSINSANILGLFPHPGFSHFKVFYPILEELAAKGHDITVVTYIKAKHTRHNYHEIIIKDKDDTSKNSMDFNNFDPSRSFSAMYSEYWALEAEGRHACSVFYESGIAETIFRQHSIKSFDLVIMEIFNTDCYLGVPHMLQVPIIGLSSCALMPWHYDRVALPDTPSFIPSEFVGFSERMTIFERLVNFIITKGVALMYRMTEMNDNEIIRNKLKINVDVRELARTTSLILVNQHYSLSGARPLPSRVIEIGGVHIQDDDIEFIPKNVEQFLQNSEHGVLFISWGSMLKSASLNPANVQEIIRALEQLPQNVLWKWESNKLPTDNEKFMFIKWAPQKDILCHPKVKYFWSHGGLLGVSESVYCGKPLIVSPVYGDQFLNGRAVENRQMGMILYHQNLDEQNILRKFTEITKSKYTTNAENISWAFRNRQNSPLETAIWWIEHVLATNGNRLSYTPAVELNWFVYYSLDVISILMLFVFSIIFIIYATIRALLGRNKCPTATMKKKYQ